MQQELLWAFFIIFAIDSIAPGPAVAMVMSRSASDGLGKTIPFIAGLVVGDLLLFLMALLGLVALVKTLGPLFVVIKWLGVAYLVYLAYKMWFSKPVKLNSAAEKNHGLNDFLLAIILPLGNPKAVGFYVALLPAFMDVKQLSIATAINFGLVIVIVWSSVLAGYALIADQGRKRLKPGTAMKWLNRGSAGAMLGAAGTIAFRE